MKRILIADDEQPILTGLKLLIKKYHAQDFAVVGEAHNGREAVELSEETAPDIILIDVQMPGLNGLEAIQTITRRGISAAFVLITAFERFEIAQEALKLGVCDYVLKPVSKERLEIALNAAVIHLEKLEYFRRKEVELAEREKQLSEVIQEYFFNSIKNNSVSKEQAYGFRSVTGIKKEYAFILLASFPNGDTETASLFTRHIQYKTEALLSSLPYEGSSVVLVPQREKSEAAADSFVSLLSGEFSRQIASSDLVLDRGTVESLIDVSHSWRAALEIKYRSFTTTEASGWNRDIDRSFFEAVVAGHHRKASSLLLETAAYAKEAGLHDRASFLRLASMIACLAARGTVPPPIFEQAMSFEHLESLWISGNHEACNNQLRLMLEKLTESDSAVQAPLVAKTLVYIKSRFTEPISLESAALAFSVTPVHLSRTLKEETGKGFARTLTETRLEHAKKMLLSSHASIKEVSNACGYQDPNYFSRAFKSYTGLTPAEYRQKEQDHEE